jgi:hypothetical protein
MSDTPQGPGWWQASDGKWYPMGQATLQPLFDHRSSAVRRKRKSSGGRVLALMVLGVLAVAGYVYGPRYYPELEEKLGIGDTREAVAPVADPADAATQETLLEFMETSWVREPEERRRRVCKELAVYGLDESVRSFVHGWNDRKDDLDSSVATPSEETVETFLAWSCSGPGRDG